MTLSVSLIKLGRSPPHQHTLHGRRASYAREDPHLFWKLNSTYFKMNVLGNITYKAIVDFLTELIDNEL